MTHEEFLKQPLFRNVQNRAYVPENAIAIESLDNSKHGSIVILTEYKARDIKYHGGILKIFSDGYRWMDNRFKDHYSSSEMYEVIKDRVDKQDRQFIFNDGSIHTKNPKSISFGKMDQLKFESWSKIALSEMYQLFYIQLGEELGNLAVDYIELKYERFLSGI
jgi:hypothetical protein